MNDPAQQEEPEHAGEDKLYDRHQQPALDQLTEPRVPADNLRRRAAVLLKVRRVVDRNERHAVDFDHRVVGDHRIAVDSELERALLAFQLD